MLGAPLVKEIDLERRVIREEILDEVDEDGRVIDVDTLSKGVVFEGHPLGMPIAGTDRTVSRLTEADLRAHHARSYGAANLAVVVAGPVERASVLDTAAAAFGSAPPGRARHLPAAARLPPGAGDPPGGPRGEPDLAAPHLPGGPRDPPGLPGAPGPPPDPRRWAGLPAPAPGGGADRAGLLGERRARDLRRRRPAGARRHRGPEERSGPGGDPLRDPRRARRRAPGRRRARARPGPAPLRVGVHGRLGHRPRRVVRRGRGGPRSRWTSRVGSLRFRRSAPRTSTGSPRRTCAGIAWWRWWWATRRLPRRAGPSRGAGGCTAGDESRPGRRDLGRRGARSVPAAHDHHAVVLGPSVGGRLARLGLEGVLEGEQRRRPRILLQQARGRCAAPSSAWSGLLA